MVEEAILTGTAEELRSFRGLKVITTASYTSYSLKRVILATPNDVKSKTTPLAKSIALTMPDGKTHIGGSIHSMMRSLSSLSPAFGLLGSSAIEEAHVNGWLQFVWTSIEVPMQALLASSSGGDAEMAKAVKDDFASALKILDAHLITRTYMVGNQITIADIALSAVLYAAVAGADNNNKLWVATPPPSSTETDNMNVIRWYQTITHQEFFLSALSQWKSSSSSLGGSAASSASSGVTFHGVPPPVQNKLYKRHRIRIREIVANSGAAYLGQSITVAGWARTTRNANKGQLLFIELNDGSTGTSLQCVLDVATIQTKSDFDECKASGGAGASFQFVGTLIESPASGQDVELQVTQAKLLGAVYGGDVEGKTVGGMLYPMSKKAHTLEHMRDNAHLRPRGRLHSAAMRVRHAMAYATHKFFHDHGFLYIHTPIITCADCEGAGEQFGVSTMLSADHLSTDVKLPYIEPPPPEDPEKKISKKEQKRLAKKKDAPKDPNKPEDVRIIGAVDYNKDFFGRRANLTVSGQLNVETHACALSDVYTFGPTFRAENSHTSRHLSEFWMIEPEITFADLTDDINLAEDYLKYCVEYALDMCSDDLEFFEHSPFGEPGLRQRLQNVIEQPFKRLTYTEAIEILQKAVKEDGIKFEEEPHWGIDLPSEHERYLCEKVFKQPVVLTNYPKEIKAFYMKLNDDGKTVAAADVLVPKIGEIIGGSQREHRRSVLIERCLESGLDPKSVWWYLDLRKYGTVPHAGFGLGFERLILFITGLDNIRDVIPFPRWAGNAEF